MAQAAKKISLREFTSSVQSAVKAAKAKHPKFHSVEAPQNITVSYLIRGFPVPPDLLSQVTLGETEAFAADVASHIATAHQQNLPQAGGALFGLGRIIIIGIPPILENFEIGE